MPLTKRADLPRILFGIVRSSPWTRFVGASALAVVVVGYAAFEGGRSQHSMTAAARAAGVLLALGASYAVDDISHRITTPLAFGLLPQRRIRLGLVVAWAVLVVGVVAGLVLLGFATMPTRFGIAPPGATRAGSTVVALAVEQGAMMMAAVAIAAVAARIRDPALAGMVANLVVLGAVAVIVQLPPSWDMFPQPDSPTWDAAHKRWLVIALVSPLVFSLASRVPRRRLRLSFRA